jgi:hypothetical protein
VKVPTYARESVGHIWLVDPLLQTLEIFEFEDDGGYTIHPLQLAEIDTKSPLMIVNCHYEMTTRQPKGGLNFDVSRDSITFHLFEAAAPPAS